MTKKVDHKAWKQDLRRHVKMSKRDALKLIVIIMRHAESWHLHSADGEIYTDGYRMKMLAEQLYATLQANHREGLELAAKLIAEGFHRPGIKKKQDVCAHGKYEWEDCEMCCVDMLRKTAALQ